MKITLTKALQYRDEELQELDLELDTLTGNDLIDVEEELKRKGVTVNAWEYSRTYLIAVAARALHIPAEALKGLNVKDFTAVVNEVLSFLAGAGSDSATVSGSGK